MVVLEHTFDPNS